MRRLPPLLLALAVAGVLAACAPVAEGLADLVERNDGATLTYVTQGLSFDPGEALARGVIVRAEGDELQLLSVPEGATCTVTTTTLDCRLGDLDAITVVGLTGGGVVANATWRRAGSSTVYLTFAEVPPEEGGTP